MLAHAIDNPPPATIILISGDRDFAYAVSILRLRRYRVVIISLGGVHASLKAQASVFLDWNTDVICLESIEQGLSSSNGRNEPRGFPTPSRSQMAPPDVAPSPVHAQNRHNFKEPDVDIMDHLHVSGSNMQQADHNVVGKTSSTSSTWDSITSHQSRSNTPDSIYTSESQTPTFRAPSRTESAPAAISSSELSPNTTPRNIIPDASRSSANTTAIASQASTSINARPLQEAANIPQDLRGGGPSPGQLPSAPKAATSIIPQTFIQATKTQTTSTTSVAPTPMLPAATGPTPNGAPSVLAVAVEPKTVPPGFKLLVQRLEFHRSKGVSRPFRSGVAVELATQDNMLYRRAGAERFGQYVALAEKAGIIELGGREGGAWIALRPEWYGAKQTP